jgi:OPA family glycerol-3-phosphate transporter-like MFS transporter
MLNFVSGGNAALSVFFSALLTGCMHGVNLILICMLPAFFRDTGKVSTISGVLNACTYVGSALSTYGTALLTEEFGWSVTLVLWVGIATAGAVICFALMGAWKRTFYKR